MNEYSIPKPKLPAAALILASMVIVGLIGLGIAAYAAFEYIGRPAQALAFALIVEAGMISEAIAIIRRNWLSIPGLIVSLLVSGMYNYTQAERAGALLTPPLTDPWQLVALSIGPLSAVLFLAMATGRELSEHETAVKQWEIDRQMWLDDQAEKEARRQERKEARAEKIALQQSTVTLQQQSNQTAIRPPKKSYSDFALALQSNGSHKWTGELIAQEFGVSESTGWNWLKRYKTEHQVPAEVSVN